VYYSCFLHPILSQVIFNPYAVAILDQIVITQNSDTAHSNIFLVGVPNSFKGTTYGELFLLMLEEYKAIVLGLYRKESLIPDSNVIGHVICNPPRDLEVSSKKDSMYIFGSFSNFEDTELVDLSNQVKEHLRRKMTLIKI